MNIDKKMMVVAGGAFLVGGLAVTAIGGLHDQGGDRSREYERGGRAMHDMMRDDNDSKDKMGMMGMDHSGMDMDMMMVASEQEFIMGMIPHHEEAIMTAKQVIERGGTTPEIKTLAENIIKAQEAEVNQMKEWYKNWYGKDYVADGKYKPMMQPLESLSGTELDKTFLSDMIKHHNMAIVMAQSVDTHIEHDEIKNLSANIKTTQSDEVKAMQNILKTLK
jgi:uncharacterized protein (DUF305 family)